jgi:hypothetical protein
MSQKLSNRRAARWIVLGILVLSPAMARADDAPTPDARLLGYKSAVEPQPGSTALQWLSLIGLGVVGLGMLFYSAKRSHLD